MLKLVIEDKKGYVYDYENVYKVSIDKATLVINYNSLKDSEYVPLKDVKLCYLIDIDSMHEYFRYEK